MKVSFKEVLTEVWRQAPVPERQDRRARVCELRCSTHSQTWPSESGFRVRVQRDSGAGTEPADQIPLGANDTIRQEGDAVPLARAATWRKWLMGRWSSTVGMLVLAFGVFTWGVYLN